MPKFEDKFRLIANLGRIQVVRVDKGLSGTKFTVQFVNDTRLKFTAELPIVADIQVGDLLTLYTEVLADEFPRGH